MNLNFFFFFKDVDLPVKETGSEISLRMNWAQTGVRAVRYPRAEFLTDVWTLSATCQALGNGSPDLALRRVLKPVLVTMFRGLVISKLSLQVGLPVGQ